MRLIYVVLLGMIIFNAVLLMTAEFFPAEATTDSTQAIDPKTGEQTSKLVKPSGWKSFIMDNISIFSGLGVVAIVATIWSRNPIYLGVGTFVAIIFTLWGSFTQPVSSILGQYSPAGVSFYNLFIICLGIVVLFSVIEMFSGQTGVDN